LFITELIFLSISFLLLKGEYPTPETPFPCAVTIISPFLDFSFFVSSPSAFILPLKSPLFIKKPFPLNTMAFPLSANFPTLPLSSFSYPAPFYVVFNIKR